MFDFTVSPTSAWQRAIIVMSAVVTAAAVGGILYFGQAVLIPLTLAVFLSLILSPVITFLERRGLNRVVAIVATVLVLGGLLGGALSFVGVELVRLVDRLPEYRDNVRGKISSLQPFMGGKGLSNLEQFLSEFSAVMGDATGTKVGSTTAAAPADATNPDTAVAEAPADEPGHSEGGWRQSAMGLTTGIAETLGTVALAVVLVIFMLVNREDLRNRVIRLIGDGQMTVTTKAVDEANHRISRYLLTQAVINTSYGIFLGATLWLVGLNYAFLFGFMAAMLRYIPFIGAWISAIFPVLLSFGQFSGWTQPLIIISVIVVLELVTNNIFEPMLYGKSMGVSPVAFMVSAAFWTFMWGGIGLVMSGPLTVCLVVLGKYVPQLKFLDVLLGDEPVLPRSMSFYQRLVARDADEAEHLAIEELEESDLNGVFERLVLPALAQARIDRDREILSADEVQYMNDTLKEILTEVGDVLEEKKAAAAAESTSAGGTTIVPTGGSEETAPVRLLCIPARDESDQLALEMLDLQLKPTVWEVTIADRGQLISDLQAKIEQSQPEAVCLGSVRPGGLSHVKYLCKRLRQKFPALKIFVARFGQTDLQREEEQLEAAGADVMVESLQDLTTQLGAWVPILREKQADKDAALLRESQSAARAGEPLQTVRR